MTFAVVFSRQVQRRTERVDLISVCRYTDGEGGTHDSWSLETNLSVKRLEWYKGRVINVQGLKQAIKVIKAKGFNIDPSKLRRRVKYTTTKVQSMMKRLEAFQRMAELVG